jgi:hypothetical protein
MCLEGRLQAQDARFRPSVPLQVVSTRVQLIKVGEGAHWADTKCQPDCLGSCAAVSDMRDDTSLC